MSCPPIWVARKLVMTLPIGHRETHDLALSGEEVVVCVDQVDRHLVRTGRQAEYVDGVAVACVRPQPRQVVYGYVQMSHARRHLERTFAKYRPMRTFSVRYWIQTRPLGKPSARGGSTISLGGGSFLISM